MDLSSLRLRGGQARKEGGQHLAAVASTIHIGSQFVAKLHAEALKRVPGAKLLAAAG